MKAKLNANFKSQGFKSNEIFELKFNIPADDVVEAIKVIMMLKHKDIILGIKLPSNEAPIKIGMFYVHNITFDAYMEAVITLRGNIELIDFVELQLGEINKTGFVIYLNGRKEPNE